MDAFKALNLNETLRETETGRNLVTRLCDVSVYR